MALCISLLLRSASSCFDRALFFHARLQRTQFGGELQNSGQPWEFLDARRLGEGKVKTWLDSLKLGVITIQ